MISNEEKKRIRKDLSDFFGERPLFYLKFCGQESYAEQAVDGDLYANTVEYYRKKEEETGIRGQGDRFELTASYTAPYCVLYADGRKVAYGRNLKSSFHYKQDDSVPIVCFVGFPVKEMDVVDIGENGITLSFPFSEEEYQTMEKEFGKYCAIVLGGNFRFRRHRGLSAFGVRDTLKLHR